MKRRPNGRQFMHQALEQTSKRSSVHAPNPFSTDVCSRAKPMSRRPNGRLFTHQAHEQHVQTDVCSCIGIPMVVPMVVPMGIPMGPRRFSGSSPVAHCTLCLVFVVAPMLRVARCALVLVTQCALRLVSSGYVLWRVAPIVSSDMLRSSPSDTLSVAR